jgi:hypothetical protein
MIECVHGVMEYKPSAANRVNLRQVTRVAARAVDVEAGARCRGVKELL